MAAVIHDTCERCGKTTTHEVTEAPSPLAGHARLKTVCQRCGGLNCIGPPKLTGDFWRGVFWGLLAAQWIAIAWNLAARAIWGQQ